MLKDYPDDRYEALKEAIGRTFGRDATEITVGNGSVELIRAFCTATLRKGDTACITPPTFAEYEMAALLAGARCSRQSTGASVRFICNPNNPTGELHLRSDLLDLLEGLRGRGHTSSSTKPSSSSLTRVRVWSTSPTKTSFSCAL
ncbi:MAG: aminotransferase class I/II-fold pyridoxal phosphate-dependent enzyme [Candidatus Methanoculleus thermohydrogenotrophicum]